jgi:hypothetical protein
MQQAAHIPLQALGAGGTKQVLEVVPCISLGRMPEVAALAGLPASGPVSLLLEVMLGSQGSL